MTICRLTIEYDDTLTDGISYGGEFVDWVAGAFEQMFNAGLLAVHLHRPPHAEPLALPTQVRLVPDWQADVSRRADRYQPPITMKLDS